MADINDVVVRGSAAGFAQEILAGRHPLTADEAVCAARFLLSPTAFLDPSRSAQVAALTGTCAFSGGMRNSLDASARRELPGSLAHRCLCDVAR